MKFLKIIIIIVIAAVANPAVAQITHIGKDDRKFNVDSLIHDLDSRPFFGIYKDNYFVLGTALNHKPNEYNSDVKFQISFRQRLTKSILPFHSHLFLSYSQRRCGTSLRSRCLSTT